MTKELRFDTDIPKICVPITGATQEAIYREAEMIRQSPAQLAEWRADYYEDGLLLEKVVETLERLQMILQDVPLLFTFRTIKEGGQQDITLTEYKTLYEVVTSKKLVDLVDIELQQIEHFGKSLTSEIKKTNVPIIISNHEFEETPADPILLYRLNMMEHFGASIGKLAVMPKNEQDVLRLMDLTRRASAFVSIPLITMSMGEMGKISRLSGKLTGSVITFGALENASAPGQIPVNDLAQALNALK
jgi:3-dehydroquinate dehydratase-1